MGNQLSEVAMSISETPGGDWGALFFCRFMSSAPPFSLPHAAAPIKFRDSSTICRLLYVEKVADLKRPSPIPSTQGVLADAEQLSRLADRQVPVELRHVAAPTTG